MRKLFRLFSTLVVAAILAALGIGASAGGALAYGHAEQPLAQIEFSGNCNNPSYPLCQPPPTGFGLGGIWVWIEIDAGGSGDVAGAGCGHIRGVGGGAFPILGEITWFTATLPPGAVPFWTDPTNTYYVVSLGDGETIPFPVTVGHYAYMPAPGVALQLQVAP
ncbi:MAG TPA: hypothetical protein VGA47_05610 [Candidatus Dormibacteraeota bacterium]